MRTGTRRRPLAVLAGTLSLALVVLLTSCGDPTVSDSARPPQRRGLGDDACALLAVRTVADDLRLGHLHQVRLPTQDDAGTPLNTCGYVDAANTPQATLGISSYPDGDPAALVQGAVATGAHLRAATGPGDAAAFADVGNVDSGETDSGDADSGNGKRGKGKLLAAAKRSGDGVDVVVFGARDGAVPDAVLTSIVSGVLGG